MNKDYTQTGFIFASTEDRSPTLIQRGTNGEMMHHSGGAASETRYIYKSVIADCLKLNLPSFKTSVVGLGLGYIEISWAMEIRNWLLQQSPNLQSSELQEPKSEAFSLVSYEVDAGLIESFQSWLAGRSGAGSNSYIYDQICETLDASSPVAEIQEILFQNFKRYPVQGDFFSEYEKDNSFNLICFDAFSQQTSQQLWTVEFLTRFLAESAHEDCALTTYACTGALKKALRDNGFQVIQRPAFRGYRDSTLALRGRFKPLASLYQTS